MTDRKPLRILLVSPMPPAMGGISVSTQRLKDNLEADGYDVTTYNVQPRHIRFIPHTLVLLFNTLWIPFYILFHRRFDIIHFHISSHWRRVYLWLTRFMFKGATVIYTIHGNIEDVLAGKMAGKILSAADYLICVRPGDKAKLPPKAAAKACEIPAFIMPADISGLFLPEDIERFVSRNGDNELPLLVFNGLVVLTEQYPDLYGFRDFADALRILAEKHPGLPALIIVNDTTLDGAKNSFVDKLRDSLSTLPSAKIVTFSQFSLLPVFSHKNVIYVRPTKTDGDSLSVREALALGASVVASDVAKRPDGTILYHLPDGPEALADAIELALDKHHTENVTKNNGYYKDIADVYHSLAKGRKEA